MHRGVTGDRLSNHHLEMRVIEERSPGSFSGSEVDEGSRLVPDAAAAAGYLSDDGTTPLVAKGGRRHLARTVLKFLLENWYKFVILGIIITLIVLVSVKGFSIFGAILKWFQARNNWAGWGIFIGLYCAVVAVFIPGVVFIMGAGFVFGFWKGLLAVWIGGSIGQALAFLFARYLLKAWVESVVRGKWRKWEYIDMAIQLDGWKLVLIMRLSPLIPYNLLNIAMATTSMPFWQFTIVSAIGIIWECAVFCYVGSMAENITSIAAGEGVSGPLEWILLGVSVVVCAVGALFVSYMIKKAVRRAQAHMSNANLAAAAMCSDDAGSSQHGSTGVGHPTYPASLDREAFLGAVGGGVHAYARLAAADGSSSPQFELKPVLVAGGSGADGGKGSSAARKLKISGPDARGEVDPSAAAAAAKQPGTAGSKRDLEMGHGQPPTGATVPRLRRASGSISGEDY